MRPKGVSLVEVLVASTVLILATWFASSLLLQSQALTAQSGIRVGVAKVSEFLQNEVLTGRLAKNTAQVLTGSQIAALMAQSGQTLADPTRYNATISYLGEATILNQVMGQWRMQVCFEGNCQTQGFIGGVAVIISQTPEDN